MGEKISWILIARVVSVCALACAGGGMIARASVDEVMQAISQSQLRFAREGSQVPFVAPAWLQDRYYPRTSFSDDGSNGGHASFEENTLSQGALMPAYVGMRDLCLIGESVTWDNVRVDSGGFASQDVVTITPVAAWLRQLSAKNLGALFVAPMFSRNIDRQDHWGTKCFAGALGFYWKSETWQWVYGLIYEYSFGKNYLYPYGGFLWSPDPKWSVAVILPWPTVTYAPTSRWLLSLSAAPGGSAWVSGPGSASSSAEAQATYSFYTWTVTMGAAWRFAGRFWLYGGAGVSGLRSLDVNFGGDDRIIKTRPGAVFTVAIQWRP